MKSKNYTVLLLRVIATLFILTCHIGTALAIGFIAQSFNVGVQIFLFISGFLYGRKLIEKPLIFIKNRVIRVTIPVIIYVIACLIVALCVSSKFSWWSLPLYVFNLQGYQHFIEFMPAIQLIEGTEHLWFITVLFICYGLTLLVKLIKVDFTQVKKWILILIFSLCVIIAFVAAYFGVRLDYILVYFIGYFVSALAIKTNWKSVLITFVLMCAFIALRLVVKKYCDEHGDIPVYTQVVMPLSYITMALFIYFGLDWIVIHTQEKKFFSTIYQSKVLGFMDKLSYPIYVVHYIFISSSVSFFLLDIHVALKVTLFLVASIAAGIVLYFICFGINKLIALPEQKKGEDGKEQRS